MNALKFFQNRVYRRLASGIGIIILFVAFNASLRKPKSIVEKSFESELSLVTPELLKKEPASSLSPQIYISLSRKSGESFKVDSLTTKISREQILRLLQLISETKLLSKKSGDLSLVVKLNEKEFQSHFDSRALKDSIPAQTLSKLLSVYSEEHAG